MSRIEPSIPAHRIPQFCCRCGASMRNDPQICNHFICTGDDQHECWLQSPHAAIAVILDGHGRTYLVRRSIAPMIGALCFPGGYLNHGETAFETVIHEARDEAGIVIDPHADTPIFLGQWHEEGPGIVITAFLVRITHDQILPFRPNHEASERIPFLIGDMNETALPFNSNRLALHAARKYLIQKKRRDKELL